MKVKNRLPKSNGEDSGVEQEATKAGASSRTPEKVDQALMRRLHNAARAMNEAQRSLAAAQEIFAMARERVELVKEIIQAKYGLDDSAQVRPDGTIVKSKA